MLIVHEIEVSPREGTHFRGRTYEGSAGRGFRLAHHRFFVAPTSLAGVTILVVDDDPSVRGLYVTVLQLAGAIVMSTGVASEAVGLIELQPPDVVLTDLRMPGHDGIWLLRELKARSPGLPVILISGHVEESRRDKLLELGFANVLTKPVPLADLANAVARVVDR